MPSFRSCKNYNSLNAPPSHDAVTDYIKLYFMFGILQLPDGGKSHLSVTELVTLSCGIVFFVTFMVAVAVEVKAKRTIYDIIRKVVR